MFASTNITSFILSPRLGSNMDFENPGFVKRQLMKVDMGIFYWIMSAFRAAVIAADFVLDLLFGVTIQHGSREGQSFHRLFS